MDQYFQMKGYEMTTKSPSRYYKILLDQRTHCVVWLSELDDRRPPPIVGVGLDYYVFQGQYNLFQSYRKYQLYYTQDVGFSVKLPDESLRSNFERIRLFRAKSTAMDILNGNLCHLYDKHNIANLEIFRRASNESWVQFVQEEYNLSRSDALKLIKFKTDEIDDYEFIVEGLRHRYNKKFMEANTIEDVLKIFAESNANLFIIRKYELDELAHKLEE